MGIIANIQYFSLDAGQEIHDSFEEFENRRDQEEGVFLGLKNYAIEVLDISHKLSKKAIVHYPKIVLISLIVSSISAILFPSISSLILLGLNFYFLYKYENLLFKAIRIYCVENVSELFASSEEKQRIIGLIEASDNQRFFFQRIENFFSQFSFFH